MFHAYTILICTIIIMQCYVISAPLESTEEEEEEAKELEKMSNPLPVPEPLEDPLHHGRLKDDPHRSVWVSVGVLGVLCP